MSASTWAASSALGRRTSISTASRSRASGVRRSCDTPASSTVRAASSSSTSRAISLKRRLKAAISRGPVSGRRSGVCPRPSDSAACCRRASGRVVRRASHHAAASDRASPPASDAPSAWSGREAMRLRGNPTDRWRPPAGSDTHSQVSSPMVSREPATDAPVRSASDSSRKRRYGSRQDAGAGSWGGSARSARPWARASSISKAGRVTGGNSLQVCADSVINPARSAAERRASGSMRK